MPPTQALTSFASHAQEQDEKTQMRHKKYATRKKDELKNEFEEQLISDEDMNPAAGHRVTHITSPLKFPKISSLAKRDSLVLIFWGISTGDVIY